MPRKIEYNFTTSDLFRETVYTLAQLQASPVVARFVPAARELLERWRELNKLELELTTSEVSAEAHIDRVDGDIDPIVEELAARILVAAKGNRKSPLYQRYYASYRPSELVRPVLGPELETIRQWPASLKESTEESIRPIGAQLERLIAEADQAVAERDSIWQQWDDLYKTGVRRTFVDDLNTFRERLHADLTALADTPEEKNLPPEFPERFFVQTKRRRTVTRDPTAAEIRAQIVELQAIADRMDKEQREREQSEAQRRADETRLAELERELETLRNRLES
jgi:hypothetical protein